MQLKNSSKILVFLHSLIALGLFGLISACSVSKQTPEELQPKENIRVHKKFFMGDNWDKKNAYSQKTFLCNWAPTKLVGPGAKAWHTHIVAKARHCNLKWQITETALLGLKINPSYIKDPSKWVTSVKIPIKKHYYVEAKKDEKGEDSNENIEESSRSHWSRRPFVDLSYETMEILESPWNSTGNKTLNVFDIERDDKTGFLAFTTRTQDSSSNISEAEFRFNFLEFQHKKDFKKNPYKDSNSKFLHLLHIFGRQSNGLKESQELYTARWDLSKTNELSLVGVPEKFLPMVQRVIEDWNEAFVEIGAVPSGHKAFKGVVRKLKYPFDLRYPSIHWVDDREISANPNSPIGIGQVHADVQNGQILWGGIVFYGGTLEDHVNSSYTLSSPSSAAVAQTQKALQTIGSYVKSENKMPQILENWSSSLNKVDPQIILDQQILSINQQISSLQKESSSSAKQISYLENIKQNLRTSSAFSETQLIKNSFLSYIDNVRMDVNRNLELGLDKNPLQLPDFSSLLTQNTNVQQETVESNNPKSLQGVTNYFDSDMTFEALSQHWHSSDLREGQHNQSFSRSFESVVLYFMSHELGHVLGLGHQFKGNIIPQDGSMPKHYIDAMKKLATEEESYTQYSSIMDYRSSTTMADDKPERIKPGEHDKLSLRYLYKSEFPTYIPNSNADKFTFFKLPADGELPKTVCKSGNDGELFTGRSCKNNENEKYKTTYFPACHDMDSMLLYDPLCNRWDTGGNAVQVAQHYWKRLTDGLVQRLFNTTNRTSDPKIAEYRLWNTAISEISRIRIFYDYMRRFYKDQISEIKSDEQALFEFSSACQRPVDDFDQIQSPKLRKMFTNHPQFKDLCQANANNLAEFARILSRPINDTTKIDFTNYYLPGGIAAGDYSQNYNQYLGTWSELTNYPLKLMSLIAVNSPYVFTPQGTSPFWEDSSSRYSFSSLYPLEYTDLIGSAISKNIQFAAMGDSATNVGKTVESMGQYLFLNTLTNDHKEFPSSYIDTIREQTKFNIDLVSVLITVPKDQTATANHYKRFPVKIFDHQSRREFSASDVYFLPQGNIIVRAENMFLFSQNPVRFNTDKSAVSLAYRVYVPNSFDDGSPRARLYPNGAREKLRIRYAKVLESCIEHSNGGLDKFFNTSSQEFKGFHIPKGISNSREFHQMFLKSIQSSFDEYKKVSPDGYARCLEARKGAAAIIATTGVLQGMWWLPRVLGVKTNE